jgi:AAA15 family ATPase/GTPase
VEYIEINNFKRIENLEINGFKRINLIGGCNNSGKSSILEAIFLLQKLNSPYIWDMLTNGIISRTYWGDNFEKISGLFYKFDFSKALSIGNELSNIKMSLAREVSETIKVEIKKFDTIEISANIFRYDIDHLKQLNDNEFFSAISKPCFFVDETNMIKTGQQDYSIFTILSRIVTGNMEQELIYNTLKMFDENITDIAIVISGYNQAEIKIGHNYFLSKIPLDSYGVGLKRVLNIVMSIVNSKGGIVLIDEIENGIHYSIMPKLWEVIIKLTKQYDCQLFATTHSLEYAGYILNNDEWQTTKDDFSFITLNLYKTGKIVPSIYAGADFESSILDDKSELRG